MSAAFFELQSVFCCLVLLITLTIKSEPLTIFRMDKLKNVAAKVSDKLSSNKDSRDEHHEGHHVSFQVVRLGWL